MLPDDLAPRFGLAVRRARTDSGQSQEALAVAAGLDRTYISSLERGSRNPTINTQARIAAALDRSLASLIQEAEEI